ncbi:MAG TPA: hypothetical protein VGJ66_10990, partial [Pyrinomonadaceae bacterium]
DTLHAAGIELCFAEVKDPVKDKLKRFGLFTRFGEQTFFATLGEAVNATTQRRYGGAGGLMGVFSYPRRFTLIDRRPAADSRSRGIAIRGGLV